jgi:WD40 repeat protein
MNTETVNLGELISNSTQIYHTQLIKDHLDGVSDLSINRQRGELATVSFDHSINIYNTDTFKLTNSLKTHTKGVWCCDYSHVDNLFLSGGNDNQVILWDTKSYKPVKQITDVHDTTVYDVTFSLNGQMFASCSKGKIALWDVRKFEKPAASMEAKESRFIYALSFTNSNNGLLASTIDGNMLLFDTNKLEMVSQYFIPYEKLKSEDNLDPGNSVIDVFNFRFIILATLRNLRVRSL